MAVDAKLDSFQSGISDLFVHLSFLKIRLKNVDAIICTARILLETQDKTLVPKPCEFRYLHFYCHKKSYHHINECLYSAINDNIVDSLLRK